MTTAHRIDPLKGASVLPDAKVKLDAPKEAFLDWDFRFEYSFKTVEVWQQKSESLVSITLGHMVRSDSTGQYYRVINHRQRQREKAAKVASERESAKRFFENG